MKCNSSQFFLDYIIIGLLKMALKLLSVCINMLHEIVKFRHAVTGVYV